MRVRPAERQCSRARGKAGSGSSTKSQTANAFARPRTGARNDVCGNLAAQRKNLAHRSCMPACKNSFAYSALRGRARFATASTRQRSAPAAERKRKERWEGIVHVVKLCVHRERPATKASLPGRTRLSTASTNQRSAPAAERKKRGRTGGPALVCAQRAPTKGVRRQQKGRKKAGRAGRDRASALKTAPCRCWSAFPGRTRLPTASANQRQQIGRKQAERAGRDRASARKAVPCRCWSAFPGRTRLPTASANQKSAPAADRKKTG